MNIAYILSEFPCRSEIFALREINALCMLGSGVTVLAATGRTSPAGSDANVKTFYRPRPFSAKGILSLSYLCLKYPLGLFRLFCLILKLTGCCRREAISLFCNLHTIGYFAWQINRGHISHIHAYFMSWPALLALALHVATGRQFSISAHARDIFVEHGALQLKTSHANFIRTCTRQGLRHLRTSLPAPHHHKLSVVYHAMPIACGGINPATLRSVQSESQDVIIAVGRLVRKKGLVDLIRAFAMVTQQRPESRLIIVGDGPERERLIDLVEEINLKDRVRFLGWLPNDATFRLIGNATLLAVPSVIDSDGDRDGIPNVILEAFVSGTCVVATRLDAITEAVRHGWTGLLVEPGNIGQLAAAIRRLLEDAALRQRLAKRAYETAIKRFDTTKNVKQLAMLLKKEN